MTSPRAWTRREWIAAAGGGLALVAAQPSCAAQSYDPWVVYYRDKLPARAFYDYRLAVFDADKHPPLATLFDRDILLLGYLSLGEVENYRADFAAVRSAGYMLMENPNWKGSYFVDVRDPRWTARIVDRLAAQVWEKGFHGFFLDTLDNPPHLEREDPKRFQGMNAAAIQLVKSLRARFPKAKIMLNRAFELQLALAQDVDFLLGESVRARYFEDRKAYDLTPEAEYRDYVAKLKAAKARNPRLQVMTLDYWSPDDPAGIKRLYAAQRAQGFAPYVATPALDIVVPEPR